MVGGTPQYQQFDPGGNLDSTVSSSGATTGYMQRRVNAMGVATEGPGASAQLIGAGNTPAAGARLSPTTGLLSSQRGGGRAFFSIGGGRGLNSDCPSWGDLYTNFGSKGWNNLKNSPPWQPGSAGRKFTSFVVGSLPGVGTAYNAYVAATGWDPIAGECVPLGGRILAGLGPVLDGFAAFGHNPFPIPRGKHNHLDPEIIQKGLNNWIADANRLAKSSGGDVVLTNSGGGSCMAWASGIMHAAQAQGLEPIGFQIRELANDGIWIQNGVEWRHHAFVLIGDFIYDAAHPQGVSIAAWWDWIKVVEPDIRFADWTRYP
jgi:hypothetical protein